MLKRLLVCLFAGFACLPACARDRAPAPVEQPPGLDTGGSATFTLPDAATPLGAKSKPGSVTTMSPRELRGSVAVPVADQSWSPLAMADEATSNAGGSYAVSDAFARMPKPRVRHSALSAALVLRIDGQEDSPLLSVGGGGVAAAMWKMRPQ